MQLMSYKDCVEYIRSDYYRISGRKGDSLLRMWSKGILDGGFRFLFWFRLAKCKNKILGGGSEADVSQSVCKTTHCY